MDITFPLLNKITGLDQFKDVILKIEIEMP